MNNLMSRRYSSCAVAHVIAMSFAVALFFTGCLGGRTTFAPDNRDVDLSTPQLGPPPAKIVSLNEEHDFVVIDYTSRTIPELGTRVDVYRKDKPVGTVRITEPVQAQFATADIVEGEVRVGDEVR